MLASDLDTTHRFFVPAAKGTEGVLKRELAAFLGRPVRGQRGGACFRGTLVDGLQVCLFSRIGQRVLLAVGEGPADDGDALYTAARSVPWERMLTPETPFSVRATGGNAALRHGHFIALRTKDAVADRLRAHLGRRPDVDREDPAVRIAVHVAGDRACFYLDLAGAPLHQRGYRTEAGQAPLRETLAAAVLALAPVGAEEAIVDPMCGSGTLVIEQAQVALGIAPGLGRRFAFHRWPGFHGGPAQAAWDRLVARARAARRPTRAALMGRDHDPRVLEVAARNARRAGVAEWVRFEQRDARDLSGLPAGVTIVTNPPYGTRLGRRSRQLDGFLRHFAAACQACRPRPRLVVLTGHPRFERLFGGTPRRRHTLFNGPLECRLLVYPGDEAPSAE
ncbi:MAG: RNA methyltransferase [Deltaproteobacteria bacterium]|nr:MAG: RNA methyltransferase [Deltaproteobacteria bacterium]